MTTNVTQDRAPSAIAATTAEPPVRTHRQILTVMSGLIIAMLLAQLDNMIISPALPTIVGDLGGLAHLSWVTTAYILASTSATLIWGKLGDIFSRKTVFMISIVIFLAGSALSGIAQTMTELIAFRAVQGIGAGGLIVGVMAVMAVLVPPAQRAKYTGYMMAVMPLSMIAGPLVGGFITDHLSWRWAFYVNIPLGLIALVVIALTMKLPTPVKGSATIDWLGAGLLVIWTTSLVLVTSWGGTQYAWDSATILILIALAVAGFIAFLRVETKVEHPILPLGVFRNLNFTLAAALSFVVGFALFGGMIFLPQFQQYVQGASATNSGLLLLPLMAGLLIMSLVSGQVITRTGKYKAFPIIGSIGMTLGLGLLATISVDTGKITTAVYMVILGLGMGCLMQITSLIGQNSVAMKDIGSATGAITFLRTMGGSLGVSLLGALYTSRLTASLTASLGGQGGSVVGSGSTLTPKALLSMPEPIRHAFRIAVTDGITGVFFWGAVVAAAGIVLSLFIKQVALRGGPAAEKAKELATAEAGI